MNTAISQAWTEHAKNHAVKSRRDFTAGYEAGAFDERVRFVECISANRKTIKDFAGDRTPELLMFMLTELRPDSGNDKEDEA